MHFDGQPEKVFRTGESLTVPDRAIHNEGAPGQRAKLTAVYVLENGKPLALPRNKFARRRPSYFPRASASQTPVPIRHIPLACETRRTRRVVSMRPARPAAIA